MPQEAENKARKYNSGRWLLSIWLLVAGAGVAAADKDATEAKLGKVREQILNVQKSLRDETTRRDSLAARLRDAELTVSGAQRQLQELRSQRTEGERQRAQVQKERAEVEGSLRAEREALAGQLRAAYRIGRQEQLKLLLNQEDPAQLGRMFVYYSYFGRSRAARIEAIGEQLARLAELDKQLADANESLARLQELAQQELDSLKSARTERSQVLRELDRQIKGRRMELARLKKQENTLEKLLVELRRVMTDFPIDGAEPFEKSKGRLAWPVQGRVVAEFGQRRSTGLKWNGVLLATARGSQVRSVHSGRVVYADWLQGMGLLTIIQHSGGYLSLYGHNEQLYKSVGEPVKAGEVIATAGDSGGRDRPELYFEIRKGIQPLDPRQWIRRK